MTKIELKIDPKFENIDDNIVKGLIISIMRSEKIEEYEILMIFTGDDILYKLKKDFFNMEHFTDVIAFRLNEYSDIKVEGEIYISIPQVQRNAKEFKEPFAKELARVIIHGNLHLLDYRDGTQKEKELMTEKEDHYLDSYNWKGII